MSQENEALLTFLSSQHFAVISTNNKVQGQSPESALIAFTEDDDLRLYFQTGRHTRKAENIRDNPNVSLVIGLSRKDGITVQYEGKAELVTDKLAIANCKVSFDRKKSPTTADYYNHPSAIFYRVAPTWIGYSDYSGGKPRVFEMTDFSQLASSQPGV